jgi:hypothetical protein
MLSGFLSGEFSTVVYGKNENTDLRGQPAGIENSYLCS